ncbi:hypothetical protein LOD99_2786 [Oopsacas minuta]|uniref:Aldose 1-epimerase n=1 Tax=Oopsacas minuta TaxID=111878 RepID=A0AAV7K115_9METZ|nr:hypothetical protein LOD99_2786 [Oopsacas minuta]
MAESKLVAQSSKFGILPTGEQVLKYTLRNSNGLEIDLLEYGAYLSAIRVPVKKGGVIDVLLGYDDLQGYLDDKIYCGCVVGRVANRIGGAKFTLDGHTYNLDKNRGEVHLHAGYSGMNTLLWSSKVNGNSVQFSCVSPDGASGYPGEVRADLSYTLTNDNEIVLDYSANTSKKCPLNMTNHAYFNLQGGTETIYTHKLTLNSSKYTALDNNLVPNGEFIEVSGTPYDFTAGKLIGQDIASSNGGYDVNYCINDKVKHSKCDQLKLCAEVETSEISMSIFTDQVGVQFYSGNFLDPSKLGKKGVPFFKHQAFCLETQGYPNSVNQPAFPDTIVSPGQTYTHATLIQFKF